MRSRRGPARVEAGDLVSRDRTRYVVVLVLQSALVLPAEGARRVQVVLTPANARLESMVFDSDDVQIFGKVVSVLRRL